jgi:acyl-coenzyme A synthetase/AMP-(fatty) acid ligase
MWRQLEHALSGGQHATLAVAGEKPGLVGREEVLEDLVHVAKAAVVTSQPPLGQAVGAVIVDGAGVAVGADPVTHTNSRRG